MQDPLLQSLPEQIINRFKDRGVLESQIWSVIRNSLNPKILISSISEILRITESETRAALRDMGFSDLATRASQESFVREGGTGEESNYLIVEDGSYTNPFPDLFSVDFSPDICSPVKIDTSLAKDTDDLLSHIRNTVNADTFANLYRKDVLSYYNDFVSNDAPAIDRYIAHSFGSFPKYVVKSGIGGDEQFSHFVSGLNNANPNKKTTWIVVDSSRQLADLPADANAENTLFMEFSRSGKTEETVKIHEFTARELKRIVFANSGPLFGLAKRDGNLTLSIPEQVSGRFGRNKTPTLLATMHVCGMDIQNFWRDIDLAINRYDLSSAKSLPLLMAKFIYLFQKSRGVNHIYLGCLGKSLIHMADEFTQFWDEGVNKNENDIMMSRYIGLPRDSHSMVEGILGNSRTKMGIFLFQKDFSPANLPSFVIDKVDPVDPRHAGINLGEDVLILSEANFQRFCQVMPCIKIIVTGQPGLRHAAVLGQLWADVTYVYSKLMNIDPGSNPEVRFVRDRSAELLAEYARSHTS